VIIVYNKFKYEILYLYSVFSSNYIFVVGDWDVEPFI
jgi:hypothetical protein